MQSCELRNRQISLTELPHSMEEFIQAEDFSTENSEVFISLGMELLVSNLNLAEAIHHLDDIKRKIILLYYFGGFNDREIGQIIGMSSGGIWYQRKKAQYELKECLEDK